MCVCACVERERDVRTSRREAAREIKVAILFPPPPEGWRNVVTLLEGSQIHPLVLLIVVIWQKRGYLAMVISSGLQ